MHIKSTIGKNTLAEKKKVPRLKRFSIGGSIKAIVKNCRSRCTCFWLDVENLSASGIGLKKYGYGHLPFESGDVLQITLDTSGNIFRRPIHVLAKVARRDHLIGDEHTLQYVFIGCEILSVDNIHIQVWYDGLQSMGDAFRFDGFDSPCDEHTALQAYQRKR